VFLIALPAAGLAAALVALTVAETPRRATPRIDRAGQLLAIAALGALTAALTMTSAYGWGSVETIALGAVGLAFAGGFVIAERRAQDAMLPARLFASRRFRAAIGIGGLFNFGLYGTLFCLGLYLDQTLHLSTRAAGVTLLPLTAIVAASATLSGRMTSRFGPRVPLVLGLSSGALSATLLATLNTTGSSHLVALCAGLFGGVGLAMPAMTSVALNAASLGGTGRAAAALNATRQTGGAVGVALLGSLLDSGTRHPTLHLAMAIVAAGYLMATLIAIRLPTRV
jgi:MFS transporter, DHA2 family, methylenomycin A resistance protein